MPDDTIRSLAEKIKHARDLSRQGDMFAEFVAYCQQVTTCADGIIAILDASEHALGNDEEPLLDYRAVLDPDPYDA